LESRAESPEIPAERPSITLSSLKPSKDTIREFGDGKLSIRLAPGEVSDLLDPECHNSDRISD
jgi:polynucleotide 5'-hydroxyl-kinase GRC3/NOL9